MQDSTLFTANKGNRLFGLTSTMTYGILLKDT